MSPRLGMNPVPAKHQGERFAPRVAAAMSLTSRISVAMCIAVLSVWYLAYWLGKNPLSRTDFELWYNAARFLVQRQNPYTAIGPGREFNWGYGFYYPLPAAVSVMPLLLLPARSAMLVFVGVGVALYVMALQSARGTRWRYVALVSRPFQATVLVAHYSFLLAAMYVFRPLAVLAVAKPNMAAAIAFGRADRKWVQWALAGSMVLLSLAFALQPSWPKDWLDSVRTDPFHSAPIARPLGFILAFALIKWRRAEARLLLGLALVPGTIGMYDALLLFFVPRRASEYIALTVLSYFAALLVFNDPAIHTLDTFITASGDAIVHWLFVPCLLMVLLRRNEGPLPDRLERLAARLPRWLRGHPVAAIPAA